MHGSGVCNIHINPSSFSALSSRALQFACTAWQISELFSTALMLTKRVWIIGGCNMKVASRIPDLVQ